MSTGYFITRPQIGHIDIIDHGGMLAARVPAITGKDYRRIAQSLAAGPKALDALRGIMDLTTDSYVIESPEWRLALEALADSGHPIARVPQ